MACDYWAFGAGGAPPGSGYAMCGECERCAPHSGAVQARAVHHEIDRAGLMPQGCKLIDIVIDVHGAVIMKYERMLSAPEIEELGTALVEAMKKVKR
jgi:hypothetical protein